MENAHEEKELRSFLLGNIKTEKKRRKIEERLMIDDDYFQLFEILEEELIQDYVDKVLTVDECKQFERLFFFSKERIEKIKFAYLLRNYLNELKKQKLEAN